MSRTAQTVSFKITGKVGDVIYQRVRKGKGNIETEGKYDLQIRSIGQPIDPRTPAQVKTRERITAATAAYKALTQQERDAWKASATRNKLTGYNLFIRHYCAAHPITEE